jgi:hypothetical protein
MIASSTGLFSAPGCGSKAERAAICAPLEREACYTGPAGTEGVGKCRSGLRTCAEDGSGFGPCSGEVLPGPEVCSALGDEDCNGIAGACTGETVWARRFTGSGDRFVRNVSVDGAGSVALGIEMSGDLDVGAPIGVLGMPLNSNSVCILKLTADGDPHFATLLEGNGWMPRVAADAAGNTAGVVNFQSPITLGGETITPLGTQDALVFALDPGGDPMFRRQISGDDYLVVNAIGGSAAGDIMIGGSSFTSVDLGGGVLEEGGDGLGVTFLGQYDSSGAHVFSKKLPLVGLHGADFDGQGNIVLSGDAYLAHTVNFGGEDLTSVGEHDSFVAKLGPSGEHVWSKRFGGSGDTSPSWIQSAPDGEGNVYLSGTFSGTWDFGGGPVTSKSPKWFGDLFLVKLDPDGNYLWGKHFGSGDAQGASSIAIDASGNVILGASFAGSIDFGTGTLYAASPLTNDIAVAKFSPNGDALWSRRFGEGNNLWLWFNVVGVAPEGHVFLAGMVAGDIDFGTGTLEATSYSEDIFVVKLAP